MKQTSNKTLTEAREKQRLHDNPLPEGQQEASGRGSGPDDSVLNPGPAQASGPAQAPPPGSREPKGRAG